MNTNDTPLAIAASLGERLRQARLNADMTQEYLAQKAGLTRKKVAAAEKGKAQLETVVAMLQAMGLLNQLDKFIPPQAISPIQVMKMQGKQRQRASRNQPDNKDAAEW